MKCLELLYTSWKAIKKNPGFSPCLHPFQFPLEEFHGQGCRNHNRLTDAFADEVFEYGLGRCLLLSQQVSNREMFEVVFLSGLGALGPLANTRPTNDEDDNETPPPAQPSSVPIAQNLICLFAKPGISDFRSVVYEIAEIEIRIPDGILVGLL